MHKHIIVRLVAYYVGVILLFTLLFYAFPALGQYQAAERARQGGRAQLELEQRFATAFLDEHAKKWRMVEVATESDGRSIIEFDLRLKKSVDLAAFIRRIEHGDPHVTTVELTRSKSKMPNCE